MRQTVWAVRHGESLIRLLSSAQAHVNPQWQGFLNMIDRLVWEGRDLRLWARRAPAADRHDEPPQRGGQAQRPARAAARVERHGRMGAALRLPRAPVPEEPFPHVNDRKEFLNRVIDGSLQALMEWRAQQASVEPSFAISRRG